MILTCPRCMVRFVVGDRRLEERSEVTHAACGAAWSLGAEEPAPIAEPAFIGETVTGEAPTFLFASVEPQALEPEFDRERLRDALTRLTTARPRIVAAYSIGGGLALMTLIELALLFQRDIARIWPSASHAYKVFGP